MDTLGIVLTVLLFDWGIGSIIKSYRDKRNKKDNELFGLNVILKDPEITDNEKKIKAMDLCRDTKGGVSHGAYLVLDSMRNTNK